MRNILTYFPAYGKIDHVFRRNEKWIIWKIEKSQVSERGFIKIARNDLGETSRPRVAAPFDLYSHVYQRFESEISLYFPRVENTYLMHPGRGVSDFTLVAPYRLIVPRPQIFPRIGERARLNVSRLRMTGDSAKSAQNFLFLRSWRDPYGE